MSRSEPYKRSVPVCQRTLSIIRGSQIGRIHTVARTQELLPGLVSYTRRHRAPRSSPAIFGPVMTFAHPSPSLKSISNGTYASSFNISTIGCLPSRICSSGLPVKVGLQYPDPAATWARDIRQSMTASWRETTRSEWDSEMSDWKDAKAALAAMDRVSLCCSSSADLQRSAEAGPRGRSAEPSWGTYIRSISGV